MSPYNILSDIKSGRIQVKSMDSATILFFKCRRWDYNLPISFIQSIFTLSALVHVVPLLFRPNVIYLREFSNKTGNSFFLPVTQILLDNTSYLCGFFLIQ